MIFVTAGTVSFPFKRLIDEVISIYKNKKETVVIQSGAYKIKSKYDNIEIHSVFNFKKMLEYYRKADVIVSACGEGSLMLILKYAKNPPIFVPRLKKYQEHVDRQQELIADYITKKNLGLVAKNAKDLRNAINKVKSINSNKIITSRTSTNQKLLDTLNTISESITK